MYPFRRVKRSFPEHYVSEFWFPAFSPDHIEFNCYFIFFVSCTYDSFSHENLHHLSENKEWAREELLMPMQISERRILNLCALTLIFCVVKRKHRERFSAETIIHCAAPWLVTIMPTIDSQNYRLPNAPRAVGELSKNFAFRTRNIFLFFPAACASHSEIMQIFSSDSNRNAKKRKHGDAAIE